MRFVEYGQYDIAWVESAGFEVVVERLRGAVEYAAFLPLSRQ